ncbi:hypothetical protein ElyMa_004300900 [Elysia marginata]|uniref:Uncharacterized protein n=1 Tax=Elysia marginata TaxID=1093978 RepID=A0AAV4GXR6_9GAST|nr:hypothetical protein ElyMa_004300900 [Elysia marginata]
MAESSIDECTFDPGHPNFFPVSHCSPDSIPRGFGSYLMFQYIKNISERTVKVVRNRSSPDRPGVSSRTRSLNDDKRLGSGLVVKAEHVNSQCKCPECQESPNPKSHCWAVIINTSTQLVYDSQEAKATQVELFNDDEGSVEEGKVITLHGAEIEETDPTSHISLLVCFTHDAGLARLLDNYRKESMALRSAILREMTNDGHAHLTQFMVICHPHGLPKRIWIGPELERVRGSGSAVSVYSARMCPGIVGAPVVVLHGEDCEDPLWVPLVKDSSDRRPPTFRRAVLTTQGPVRGGSIYC